MISSGLSVQLQTLRENARRARVSYEIFPALTHQAADVAVDWFEVVLHAESHVHEPVDCPESQEVITVLQEVAEFLKARIPLDESCNLHLSAWYYTAPVTEVASSPPLFRSLSLAVLNIAPYGRDKEPPLLVELKTHLNELGISRIR